jgi:hypothetical protein
MEEKAVLQRAMDGRLDLDVAKRELDGLAKSLGLVKATRFVNVLEVSYLNNNVSGQPHARGYEIELSLPIFDWGGARTIKAEALYTQAMHRVAELAVNAESEVRDAYAGYRATHELAASYRDEIVPLRKSLSEEALLRYNGMLIGVWDLLADTRSQVAAVNAAIQAPEGILGRGEQSPDHPQRSRRRRRANLEKHRHGRSGRRSLRKDQNHGSSPIPQPLRCRCFGCRVGYPRRRRLACPKRPVFTDPATQPPLRPGRAAPIAPSSR